MLLVEIGVAAMGREHVLLPPHQFLQRIAGQPDEGAVGAQDSAFGIGDDHAFLRVKGGGGDAQFGIGLVQRLPLPLKGGFDDFAAFDLPRKREIMFGQRRSMAVGFDEFELQSSRILTHAFKADHQHKQQDDQEAEIEDVDGRKRAAVKFILARQPQDGKPRASDRRTQREIAFQFRRFDMRQSHDATGRKARQRGAHGDDGREAPLDRQQHLAVILQQEFVRLSEVVGRHQGSEQIEVAHRLHGSPRRLSVFQHRRAGDNQAAFFVDPDIRLSKVARRR